MRQTAIALSLSCWLAAGGSWAAPAGFVYTANERADSISQVQLESGAIHTAPWDERTRFVGPPWKLCRTAWPGSCRNRLG